MVVTRRATRALRGSMTTAGWCAGGGFDGGPIAADLGLAEPGRGGERAVGGGAPFREVVGMQVQRGQACGAERDSACAVAAGRGRRDNPVYLIPSR
jgi:hypothetical protein